MVGELNINSNGSMTETKGLHSHKLMLFIAMGSITMMFAGLTSAYLVKRAHGNWMEFALPNEFLISSLIILLSSVFVQLATKAVKNNERNKFVMFTGITIILGFLFGYFQILGWQALTNMGVYLVEPSSAAGSFLYVISGLHTLHIVGGLVFLIIMFIKGIIGNGIYKKPIGMELTSIYWHFVDALWIYLFVFFTFNY